MDHHKFLSQKEMQDLQTQIVLRRTCPINGRHSLLVEFILHTGCRPQEALNCTFKDLNSEHMSVLIHGLKGSLNREIPLPKEYFKRLEASGPVGKLFNVHISHFRKVFKLFSKSGKGAKGLRHTFALRLYQKTKDIKLVQVALGHKSIVNTMVYVNYSYSTHELRSALIDENSSPLRSCD